MRFALTAVLGATAQNDTVVFFCRGAFSMRMSFYWNCTMIVRSTTSATPPTAIVPQHSPPVMGGVMMNASMYSKSDIYTIVNTIPSALYLPNDAKRGIVIRAALSASFLLQQLVAYRRRPCRAVTILLQMKSGCVTHPTTAEIETWHIPRFWRKEECVYWGWMAIPKAL